MHGRGCAAPADVPGVLRLRAAHVRLLPLQPYHWQSLYWAQCLTRGGRAWRVSGAQAASLQGACRVCNTGR